MSGGLPARLADRLAQPLPDAARRAPYEAVPRLHRHDDECPADARQAAVLVLLYPRGGRWHVPLMLRPKHLPDHAGQVGLPGGTIEPGEASHAAAVREFHEELGAAGLEIRLLGPLTPIYVQASNFRVAPWVGVAWQEPHFAPNPIEVAELLEVPLAHLANPETLGCHDRHYQGIPYRAPHFLWERHQIWGATCRILGEFVTLLNDVGWSDDVAPA